MTITEETQFNQLTDTWDVIVVGAGPAGSTAARIAAKKGARVLLVEREIFPRYKTCGGGLTGVSLQNIPASAHATLQQEINGATLSRGSRGKQRNSDYPFLYTTQREDFDAALVAAAKSAGAEVIFGATVTRADNDGERVVLTTNQGVLVSRAVVGADGSASRLARQVGVHCIQLDLGLEVELDAGASGAAWNGRIHLDWGPLRGSYGWVFPKRDVLTVGVIASKTEGVGVKDYLDQFLKQVNLDHLPRVRSSGHLTRCRAANSPLSFGRIVLAGDAAGLLEPFTREGISFALRSGRLAGLAAAGMSTAHDTGAERITVEYTQIIESTLGREMRTGQQCLEVFSRYPDVFHCVISSTPYGWNSFAAISAGKEKATEVTSSRWLKPILRLLAL